jgi:hypothetical protein
MTDEETNAAVDKKVTDFFAKLKEKINKKSWRPKNEGHKE